MFPGIGLLDRAFEEEGFCIVRGPDVLWGGDIRRFHVPPAFFSGVIGLSVVANGVPLFMGRALARAVKQALGLEAAA